MPSRLFFQFIVRESPQAFRVPFFMHRSSTRQMGAERITRKLAAAYAALPGSHRLRTAQAASAAAKARNVTKNALGGPTSSPFSSFCFHPVAKLEIITAEAGKNIQASGKAFTSLPPV